VKERACILAVELSSRYVRMAVRRFPDSSASIKKHGETQPTNDMEIVAAYNVNRITERLICR
jgi:hypothetical protein